MSDYPMLISNKLHSFRNFQLQIYEKSVAKQKICSENSISGKRMFIRKEAAPFLGDL